LFDRLRRGGEESKYGTLADIITIIAFGWLVIKAIIDHDWTAVFPLAILGILIIHYFRTRRIMYPYIYEEEEATLEFKESDCHRAIYTLSGIVRPNVEGWKLFDSTHLLPGGGKIGGMGETYEGFETLHYKEPGFYGSWMVIRVLKTPLEKGTLYPFSHWLELIDCYPKPNEDFGIKVITPIKKQLRMSLIFGPNQKHENVTLNFSKGERTVGRSIPFDRFVLEDGRVKYTGRIERPETEGVYLYTWSW
jgi:hypothetical protein